MDSSASASLPTWVRKRDGSRVPFDADKINRALFAATETLGEPDAFIARELTDGVLHFLRAEHDGNTISSSQIEETLVKVVRELGQPKLAKVFADFGRQRDRTPAGKRQLAAGRPTLDTSIQQKVGPTCRQIRGWIDAGATPADLLRMSGAAALEAFSLEEVFSKNLAAAHREGLLVLGGLSTPLELAAAVVGPTLTLATPASGSWRAPGIFEVVEQARHYVGETLVLDAPERELAQRGARIGEAAAYIRELGLAARSTGLQLVLNLGSESSPDWAEESTGGPLFVEQRRPEGHERILGHLEALVDQALSQNRGTALQLNWHLSGRDFEDDSGRRRLTRLVRAACPVTFICDRPRRPVSLAEGLDRRHPALLLWVGLNLPHLLRRQGSLSADAYLKKLESLARLAATAGVQKRQFLRVHPPAGRPAFLSDRAHLGMYLIGLPEVLRELLGTATSEGEEAVSLIEQLLRHLQEALQQEAHVECLLDDLPNQFATDLLPHDDWKSRLRLGSRLQAITGRGTVFLPLETDKAPQPGELIDMLHFAWRQTSVTRLRLVRPSESPRQLTVSWAE